MEDAPVRQENSRWRQAGALRREIVAVWRVVRDAAQYRGRRVDHRGFRQLSGFAAAEGNSPGDEKRDAGGRDDLRSAEEWGRFDQDARQIPGTRGKELCTR